MTKIAQPQTEMTPEGEQAVIDGVRPLTLRDRLQFQAGLPLEAKGSQKPCDLGLFDLDARRQIDWLDELRKLNPFAETCDQSSPRRASCSRGGRGLNPSRKEQSNATATHRT